MILYIFIMKIISKLCHHDNYNNNNNSQVMYYLEIMFFINSFVYCKYVS